MSNKKKNHGTKIIVTILSIVAILFIVIIIAAACMIISNNAKNRATDEKLVIQETENTDFDEEKYLSMFDENKKDNSQISSEDNFTFKVPVVTKASGLNPFENLTAMDTYARNTPESFLGTVHFAYGKYEVNTDEFRQVMTTLDPKQLETTWFIIEGHTDTTSEWEFNKDLSEKRADAVKKMIIHLYGVDESRIMTAGYSWDRLAVKPEVTKEDKAANRRTEISCFRYE